MLRSEYNIPKMDCPSEENMIRLKLDGLDDIRKLDFNLDSRTLYIMHSGDSQEITDRLEMLNLGK